MNFDAAGLLESGRNVRTLEILPLDVAVIAVAASVGVSHRLGGPEEFRTCGELGPGMLRGVEGLFSRGTLLIAGGMALIWISLRRRETGDPVTGDVEFKRTAVRVAE